jgi:hypothetical protein
MSQTIETIDTSINQFDRKPIHPKEQGSIGSAT